MKRILLLLVILITTTIKAQVPANDICSNAQAIVIPSSGTVCVSGTNLNATSDNTTNTCDVGTPGNEVWFKYTVTGANNSVTVTPSGASPASNMVVTLISSGCSSGVYDVCNSGTGSNAVTASVGLTPGMELLISVETNGTDGTFELCVSSLPPDATAGNTCSAADMVCNKSNISYPDMSGFTASGSQPSCFGGYLGATWVPIPVREDSWVIFSVGTTGTLEWLATPTATGTEFDWAVFDITSGCPGTEVGCNYDFTGNTASFGMSSTQTGSDIDVPITVTAGHTYAILIDNYSQNSTGFNLSWAGSTFQMGTAADFSVSPNTACAAPVTVTLTNNSTGASSYDWNFGDGTSSTSANPGTHTYTTNGDFLVSLTVTNGTCTDVISHNVNLNKGPVIVMTPTSATVCAGSSANLGATISYGVPSNTYTFTTTNTNQTITNNSTTGISNSLTSSGMMNTTLGSGMLQSICFTINHTDHRDFGYNGNANAVYVTVNGVDYLYSPIPISTTASSGSVTFCFPQSVLNAIMAAGGNSNTTWSLHVADTRGGGGGTGSLTTWSVVLKDTNSVTYSWSPTTNMTNSTTLNPTVTPTVTTTYTLTATDLLVGCTTTDSVTVVVAAGSVTANVPSNASYCTGDIVPSGSITSTPAGATFTWTNSNTSIGLAASGSGTPVPSFTATNTGSIVLSGVISVTPTSGGCSGTPSNYTITVNPKPGVTNAITTTTGCGTANASLTPTSSVAGATFAWTAVNTGGTITGFTASGSGNISETLTNSGATAGTVVYTIAASANGCTGSSVTYSVVVNPLPTLNVSGTNAICNGSSTSLTASGTASTYTWSPASSLNTPNGATVTATPTTSVQYTVTGTDGNGCVNSNTYDVTVNANPTAIDFTVTDASCGANDGTLTINSATGGTPGYQYNFNNLGLSGTTSFSNLAANSYPLVVSDANSCTYSTTVNVSNAGGPTAVQTASVIADSCGRTTGEFSITGVTGGAGGNTFSVDGSAYTSNTDYTGLGNGSHTIVVKDQNGCSYSTSVTIPALTGPTGMVTGSTNETCGSANGSIVVSSVNGGTATYQYSIDGVNFGSSNTFSNLAQGTYTITVMDANTCEYTDVASITNTSGPTAVDSTIIDASCGTANGEIDLGVVTGGTGPYTYSIDGTNFSSSTVFSGLSASTYTITVQDNNSCLYTTSITVSNTSGPSATTYSVTDESCGSANGAISISSVTGGSSPYQYSLDGGAFVSSTLFNNLSAGSHTVTVKDNSGCTYDEVFNVANTSGPGAVAVTVTDETCGNANGSVDITGVTSGTAPYQYDFNGQGLSSATTYSNLTQGTYSLQVVDANSCTYDTTISVSSSSGITSTTNTLIDESCGQLNGSIEVHVVQGGSAPYQYSINGGAAGVDSVFTGLAAGSYTVEVIDALSCTYTQTLVVNGQSGPTAADSTITAESCGNADGSITINTVTGGTGPYTYSLNGGVSGSSTTFTNLSAGSYTVVVTDANNCTYTTTETIGTISGPTAADSTITPESCGNADGSITINAVTGGTGALIYSLNGGASGSSATFTNLTAGSYTISITDANNCSYTTIETVGTVSGPTAADSTITPETCGNANGSITINTVTGGTGPYNYSLNGGVSGSSSTFTNLAAGSYTISIADANNCSYTSIETVGTVSGPTTAATAITDETCGQSNGSITVSSVTGGTSPYQYSINGGSYSSGNTFSGLTANAYTITVMDANSCSITLTPSTVASISGPTGFTPTVIDAVCGGSNGTIDVAVSGGTSPYQYNFNAAGYSSSNLVTGLSMGTYNVDVMDVNGCVYSNTVVVGGTPAVSAAFTADPTLGTAPLTVNFTNSSTPNSTYAWDFGNGNVNLNTVNPQQTYTTSGTYTVVLLASDPTNPLCFDSASAVIIVDVEATVVIPNIFSPNGDNINDQLLISVLGYKEMTVDIFNRWGTKMVSLNPIAGEYWNGDKASEGTYFYIVKGTTNDGKDFEQQGTVMLVK